MLFRSIGDGRDERCPVVVVPRGSSQMVNEVGSPWDDVFRTGEGGWPVRPLRFEDLGALSLSGSAVVDMSRQLDAVNDGRNAVSGDGGACCSGVR